MDVLNQCRQNPNMCVPFLLMASYLYYIEGESPPTTDSEYDALCRLALENWPRIQHVHKHLIKKADLAAGSLYALPKHKYPRMVRGAAWQWKFDVFRSPFIRSSK